VCHIAINTTEDSMTTAITARPMIYKEARECADRINQNLSNIRQLVIDLHDRDGWSALGYKTWTDCVEQEFKQCRSYIFFQFAAAQIEMNVTGSTKVDLGKIPETQLRPLNRLEPAQQREAWQKAVDTAPDGKVTAAHVYKIVKDMTMEPPPPPPPKPEKCLVDGPVSEEFQDAFDEMEIQIKNARAMRWKATSHKSAIEMMRILLNMAEL